MGGNIGVGLERGDSVTLDISKRRVDVSSLASEVSVVGGGTINELLLGESGENVGFQESVSLNDGNGGESPTRSTRLLVWSCIDGSGSSPVDSGIETIEIGRLIDLRIGVANIVIDSKESFNEFLIGHIHELVFSQLIGAHWVIVNEFNLLKVFPENRKSVVAVSGVLVGLILGLPSDVSSDNFFWGLLSSFLEHGRLKDDIWVLD